MTPCGVPVFDYNVPLTFPEVPMPIVYRATNRLNSDCYIGATKQPFWKRQSEHRSASRRPPNSTRRCCRVFNAAIRKYGWDAFVWDVVAICDTPDETLVEEARLIKELKPYYNISCGGYNGARDINDGQADLSLTQKPVRCVSDGQIYKSISAAAEAYGIRMSLVSGAIYRRGKTRGLQFEFLDHKHRIMRPKQDVAGLRGVLFRSDKRCNPWQARVWFGGEIKTLGFFASKEEAHRAHLAEQDRLGVYDAPRKSNISGFRCVVPHGEAWQAWTKKDGKKLHLGTYATAKQAHQAVLDAKQFGIDHVRRVTASRPAIGARTPYRGVELCGNRWRARYRKQKIGMFDTAEAAHEAYLKFKGLGRGL